MAEWVKDETWGKYDIYISHLDGIPWHEAKKPRRWHRCRPQTSGLDDRLVHRCACGAIRFAGSDWMERNSR